MGEVWKDCAGEGKVKERDHTYLAILVFCPRDLSEFNIGALAIKEYLCCYR